MKYRAQTLFLSTLLQVPGQFMVLYCIAMLLAVIVLDPECMAEIEKMGDAPYLFTSCLSLVETTVEVINRLMSKMSRKQKTAQLKKTDSGRPELNPMSLVKLAEASAQAVWGSARSVVNTPPLQIRDEEMFILCKWPGSITGCRGWFAACCVASSALNPST